MSSPPTRYRSPRLRRPSTSGSSAAGLHTTATAAGAAAAATSPPRGTASSPGVPDDVMDADVDADADADGGEDGGGGDDMPLTMTASVMLSQLPRDATAALADAGAFPADLKVVVRFKPVGSAPPLKQELSKIRASQRFDSVVVYLRRKLQVAPTDSVFLYINSTFAPALDEVVGNLHRCFKDSKGQLNVAYSMTPAFG